MARGHVSTRTCGRVTRCTNDNVTYACTSGRRLTIKRRTFQDCLMIRATVPDWIRKTSESGTIVTKMPQMERGWSNHALENAPIFHYGNEVGCGLRPTDSPTWEKKLASAEGTSILRQFPGEWTVSHSKVTEYQSVRGEGCGRVYEQLLQSVTTGRCSVWWS